MGFNSGFKGLTAAVTTCSLAGFCIVHGRSAFTVPWLSHCVPHADCAPAVDAQRLGDVDQAFCTSASLKSGTHYPHVT